MSPSRTANAPFNATDADIALRTSDNVKFHVFKAVLSLASPVFKDMFAIPQPPTPSDAVPVSEDSSTIEKLLLFCYPGPDPSIDSVDEAYLLMEAADKYDITFISQAMKTHIASSLSGEDALRLYCLACRDGWEYLARIAAFRTLSIRSFGHPTILQNPDDLELITAAAYQRLLVYHAECREVAKKVAQGSLHWTSKAGCQVPTCCAPKTRRIVETSGVGTVMSSVCAWWSGMISAVGDELSERPAATTVTKSSEFALAILRKSKDCGECEKYVKQGELSKLTSAFAEQVVKVTSEVELEWKF